MDVFFAHPRNSKQFVAEVGSECTGQQAVDGLIVGNQDGPFLEVPPPGRPYQLVLSRTDKQIAPNMTLGESGVVDGDIIQVIQPGQGA